MAKQAMNSDALADYRSIPKAAAMLCQNDEHRLSFGACAETGVHRWAI